MFVRMRDQLALDGPIDCGLLPVKAQSGADRLALSLSGHNRTADLNLLTGQSVEVRIINRIS